MYQVAKKFLKRIKSKFRRIHNMNTAYLYPAENDGWRKYKSPVLGGDKETYFDPFVRRIKDKYIMAVSYRNHNTIRIAYSDNGISWSDPLDILAARPGMWDSIVNRASFVLKGDKYYLWYTGQNEGKSCIGMAMSEDGILFKRCRTDAVIVADKEYEGISVMNPCVMWDEEERIFKMWYAAGENYEPDVICYAESIDGINWSKYRGNPVLKKGSEKFDQAKVGGCDVIKHERLYHMFYIGYENIDNARICHAISHDGMSWNRLKINPILSPSKDGWDRHAVYKPTVCVGKDKWYIWYNGRIGRKEYIGLAVKEIL